MSVKEMRDLCEDLLDTLLFGARIAACSYGVDVTGALSQRRANLNKHKGLEAEYCMYHDLMDILKQHGYVEEYAYTWETVKPVVEEMETLAAALSLSKTLEA